MTRRPRGRRALFLSGVLVLSVVGGTVSLAVRYVRTGTGEYDLEELEPGVFADWFPDVDVRPDEGGRTDGASRRD